MNVFYRLRFLRSEQPCLTFIYTSSLLHIIINKNRSLIFKYLFISPIIIWNNTLHASSYLSFIVTMAILYHFREKARYWSKIAIFHTPLYLTTPLGKGCDYFLRRFLYNRVRWLGYDVVQKLWKSSAFWVGDTNITDRQTDRQTHDRRNGHDNSRT